MWARRAAATTIALTVVVLACGGGSSVAAGDPCAVELAVKDAAVAVLSTDVAAERSARRQIAFIEADINHWNRRARMLNGLSERYAALAAAMQPRIDAAPPGSPRRVVLERRQSNLRFLADTWADEAFAALVRADSAEAGLFQVRQQLQFAAAHAAEDQVALDAARQALAACRAIH